MVNTLYAKINHPDSPDAQKFFFRFPNTDSEIGRLLQTLELPETGKEKNCAMHEPSIFGKSFPMLEGKRCNLDEVNYLAKRLARIDRNATTLFLAVAEATHADDVEKLIQLTFNTACYSVVNQFDDLTSLGKQLYLSEHPTVARHKKRKKFSHKMQKTDGAKPRLNSI